MNILITGVHGFVGSNLVKALAPYHTIFGIDIVFPPKEGVAKTFSWEDLYSDNVPETDVIIHLAGKAHDTKNKAAKEVYFKVNTGLTEKIFDYFLRSKSKKFIFFNAFFKLIFGQKEVIYSVSFTIPGFSGCTGN